MAVALDTNCLLRWQLGDVLEQAALMDACIEQSKTQLHVTDVAMIEMAYVLEKVYKFDRPDVAAIVEQVIKCAKIRCNRVVFRQVLPVYVKERSLSLTDIYLAHRAEQKGLETLYTFDKALAKRLPELASLLAK